MFRWAIPPLAALSADGLVPRVEQQALVLCCPPLQEWKPPVSAVRSSARRPYSVRPLPAARIRGCPPEPASSFARSSAPPLSAAGELRRPRRPALPTSHAPSRAPSHFRARVLA